MTLATIRVIARVAARPVLVVHTVTALLLLGATAIASADHGPANVTSLVIDPAMPTTIYAGTGDRGLLKSSNGAATWTPTGLASSAVTAVAIDSATTPATLYAGTSDVGVLKSTDGGATWTATGLGGVVQGVTVAPGVPGRVYAVVAGMGAFRSDTAGASWNPIEPPNALGLALAVDSVTAGTVYVGTSNGVYRSADGGTTWDLMGLSGHTVSTLVSHASALFAATQYGIFRSIGGGAWTPTERMPSAMDVQIPTTLYAGTASGVFKSLDGGDTWSAANAGLTDVLQAGGASSAIGPMAIDPTAPQIVFAATQLGLFKSMDSAGTWQHPVAEDCFNGIDDDGDGISDNYDPDCPLTCLMGEFCPGGYICNPNGYCEPHCGNGFKDGDEGGVDCGGSCDARCHIGQTCWVGSDCDSGICTGSICVAQAAVGAINLAPASVSGGTSSTGTVILTGAAPAAGIVVTLSSSNTAAATVPADVTVVAGSTSATFTVATSAVTTSTAVTISATAGGAIRSAQLTVTAVASLSSLSLAPASVRAGATSTATIVLSAPAPPGGVAVSLRSDTTAASVPASASVAAGAASATFVIATNVMAASTSVIISATLGSSTKTAALSLTGLPDFQIASVSAPASVARGRAISVTAQVRNAGAVSAPASVLRFYLSLDGSIDSTDLLVASRDVAALATGASVTLTTTMTIPKTVAPGTYRIIAVIDPTSSVPEQNESNNVRASAPITVLRQAASNVLPNSSQ